MCIRDSVNTVDAQVERVLRGLVIERVQQVDTPLSGLGAHLHKAYALVLERLHTREQLSLIHI